ncbi:flagellar basal body rod protein FlgB [Pelagerythrobacter marensis]|uniref:Flagellar basal body rod protein FlgB n=1 Tax=Pelagerythrobacter marensis TaxID=543877 RepID=A0ABZ2D638_9SPHN
MSEGLFGIHGAALEIRAQRMGMLGSNIANAATPGYKARDIDFAAALEAKLGGAGDERAIGSATRYRVPVMPSLDGNTVEMATEQAAFAENAVAYTATLGFLRGRVETLTRAIKGE